MLEQEYKQLISPATFAALQDAFPWEETLQQVNHYYTDVTGELRRRNVSLRVRVKDGNCYLQAKLPVQNSGGLHINTELERPLDSVPALLSDDILREFLGFSVGEATLAGSLTTLRRVYRPCDGVELCLDENHYPEHTDYEVELEFLGESPPSALMEILAAQGIDFSTDTQGKYTRFIHALNNITED